MWFKVWLFKKLWVVNCPHILSPLRVLVFFVEWVSESSSPATVSSRSMEISTWVLTKARSSSSLCHRHGDSTERSRSLAAWRDLSGDTQCFLAVPQAHMETYTDSSSIKEMKGIDFSLSLLFVLLTVPSLSVSPSPHPHLYSLTYTRSLLSADVLQYRQL